MNPERIIAVIRDAGCMTLGLLGIAYQQYTGNVNALLLGAYMTLLGIPVGVNARNIRRQLQRAGTGGTRASSSSPQSSASSPSSQSGGDS